MKALSSGVRVGVLMLLCLIGGYAVWKSFDTSYSGEDSIRLHALFRDASGLPVGSKVMVAGLPVGEIASLSIDGRYALLRFRVREEVPIFDNAVVFKKSSSLLGSYYLELDPGMPESVTPDGMVVSHKRLGEGDRVERVVEATTVDELIRRVDQSMPNVDRVLLSVHDLSEDMRKVVNGPLASTAARIDDLVQKESDTVSRILARADRSMERIELITADIRAVTGSADERVNRILGELEEASREARELMVTARAEVADTGAKVREKLDLVDEVLSSSSSIAKKIDENEGTLGRLVNDPAIADNVEELTDDARGFVKTLTGMQTYVGLRSEYNIVSRLTRHYITVELATRPDKYYLIELEKGPRGAYPEVTLEYDPLVDPTQYIRRVRIEDKIRFTFQFAKRIGRFTFRYGLKESTGGIGMNYEDSWLGRRLRVDIDLFDMNFDRWPRLKVAAAYEVFSNLYILGGIDEALNQPEELAIDTGNFDEPTQFDHFTFGRDYFFGAMLRFNDRDLAALMTVGGAALGSVAE